MKTKVNYPFIYFFMEPNVVFVYKIETNHYLSFSNLSEFGEWQTYEINHPEEFDTFHHEKFEPLVGRGYAISYSDDNMMLEIINKQIQKHRIYSQDGPVHIVIGESAAGSLRYSLERPKEVIGFPDFFSIGPVWKLDEKIGQTSRNEWLYENINTEQDDFVYENKFANTLLEMEDIPEQVKIYLWTANNANEQTGHRFILKLLTDKTNEVFLINSTDIYEQYISQKGEVQPYHHTSQMEPEDLRQIFEIGKKRKSLSSEERTQYQKEWQKLSLTKEVLRIWRNNEIVGVAEEHYDSLILNTLEKLHREQESKDFIRTARVIGDILGQMEEFVSDSFLEYRIRHLVYSGVLELKGVPRSMRHYSVMLR
jgi:hypothetical protein